MVNSGLAMIKVGIFGAAGRMGRTLLEAVNAHDNLSIASATEHWESPLVGSDSGFLFDGLANTIIVTDNVEQAVSDCDVCINFTRPEPTLSMLQEAVSQKRTAIIGTTGFTESQKEEISKACKTIPIVFAANYSVGVTVHLKLLEIAAKYLGDDYDVEIVEAHHRFKVDSPSGTALKMGEVVASALGRDLTECAVYGRQGHTGERDRTTIGFETIRGGDVVGDHTVLFAGIGERLEVTHKASNRMTFATGAVRAAEWINDQQPGLYDMHDVLGL